MKQPDPYTDIFHLVTRPDRPRRYVEPRHTYIDVAGSSSPEDPEDPVQMVVRIIEANLIGSVKEDALTSATHDDIVARSEHYLAAVTALVIEGRINVDDGRDLMAIVNGVLKDARR